MTRLIEMHRELQLHIDHWVEPNQMPWHVVLISLYQPMAKFFWCNYGNTDRDICEGPIWGDQYCHGKKRFRVLPLETITWSSMTLSALITSLWRNFSPLFFTAPTHFIEVCGYSFMHHCPVVRPSFGQANLCFGLVCPTDCVPEVGWFV